MWPKLKTDLKFILGIFIVWRIAILVVAFLGVYLLTANFANPNLASATTPKILSVWANWDGGHFLGIAKNGYANFSQFAFFPAYPLLINFFSNFLGGNFLLAGLLVSNVALVTALYFLYQLIKLDFAEITARRTIFYFLIFPTAFFLGAVYAESVFILTVVVAFFYARKNQWLKSGLASAIATSVKPFGIFLYLALIVEYLLAKNFKIRPDFLLFLIIAPAGLIFYLIYLHFSASDFLAFFTAQANWQRALVNPLQPFYQSALAILVGDNFTQAALAQTLIEWVIGVVFLALLISNFSVIRFSYFLFSLLVISFAAATGTLVSLPRFVLVAFPVFVILAKLGENYVLNYLIIFICAALLGLFTALFVNGVWIA